MQPQFWLPIIGVAMIFMSSASAVDIDTVPFELRCPDGRIPLNSPQARCRSLPQLQWAGRKCDNGSNFSCPPGYSCLGSGLCCDSPRVPQFKDDLCRLDPSTSNVMEVAGSCATDSECKSDRSPLTKCCGGKCVLLMQRCFQKLQEYLNIQSTGRLPRQYLPSCTDDGAFAPVQSEPRFNLRWCVDPRTGLAQRTGCCLPGTVAAAPAAICADIRPCPRDLCAMQTCPARPDAQCRVNPCGSCRVEFVDSSGRLVDCLAGQSQCQVKAANYYDGLAWLRARDQTQWRQTDFANKPVTADAKLAASMDTCQADNCVPYNASRLELLTVTTVSRSCPKQNSLGYVCPNKCQGFAGCNRSKGQVCCNSGCGLECMTPADIYPEAQCRMKINSGHCPAVGCFRMCRRWGYDTVRRTCRPFWYAGSGGNNNRYNSWSECMWYAQNCHGQVLLALPVKPLCSGSGYGNVQIADNAMFWCVNKAGTPTPGTLHADSIACSQEGQLVRNKYYQVSAYLYQGRCANGSWPAWCQDISTDRTCGTPGVTTFADACNSCRLVHVNADGDEVACQTDAAACAAASSAVTSACPQATGSRFDYSPATGRCEASSAGAGTCGLGVPSLGYTRESGCLQACAAGWCQNGTVSPTAFYPDLCVGPNATCAAWPGSVCVPDECTGRERYFLPNGTEAARCVRQVEPLNLLTSLSNCGSTQNAATTRVTTAPIAQSSGTQALAATTKPISAQTAPASTTSPKLTTTGTPTQPPLKTILPICRLRSQMGAESLRCRITDGRYESKQCNDTHCFCVVMDSGALAAGAPPAVPVSNATGLLCPIVTTTNLSVSITYDAEFMEILPTANEEAALQRVVARQFSLECGLHARHIRSVDLEPGSIIVTVVLGKEPEEAAIDLPASSFELKTMALKQVLTLDFNGIRLTPSARQDFNEISVGAPIQKLIGSTASTVGVASQLNVAGIVAGVLITVVVVAVAGVIVAFTLRRRGLMGSAALPHESGDYETMSNSSASNAYDNFANKVYGPVEDVYDNIARTTSNA